MPFSCVTISWSHRKIRPREVRWGPAEICQNLSAPQLTGKAGHQWTQLLLHLLGEASGQHSGMSTEKRVADSWWSVQTPACHDVRESAYSAAYSDATTPQSRQANWAIHCVCGDTWSPTFWPILHVMCIPVSQPQFGYGIVTDIEEYRDIPLLQSSL